MLWIFERNHESLQLETRYDGVTQEYVAVIRHHDGRHETARFSDLHGFGKWLSSFETDLQAQEWRMAEFLSR